MTTSASISMTPGSPPLASKVAPSRRSAVSDIDTPPPLRRERVLPPSIDIGPPTARGCRRLCGRRLFPGPRLPDCLNTLYSEGACFTLLPELGAFLSFFTCLPLYLYSRVVSRLRNSLSIGGSVVVPNLSFRMEPLLVNHHLISIAKTLTCAQLLPSAGDLESAAYLSFTAGAP